MLMTYGFPVPAIPKTLSRKPSLEVSSPDDIDSSSKVRADALTSLTPTWNIG